MSRERHLLNRIQQQADKIKELEANLQDYSVKWDMKNKKLEADWLDEHTKGVMKTKEIEKLNRIIKFIKRGMDGNEQFEQVLKDLEGGHEEKFYCNDGENFKFGVLERCSTQCESCKIGGKETQEVNRSEESSNGFNTYKMKKYTIALIWITAIGLIAMVLFSCSASYHFGKFLKKGGKVENKTEYVSTTDTIRINGKDSIITVRVPVSCPEVQIPPTRQEIRYKYKLQRDSIQTVRYVTKWKTKKLKIEKKAETKQLKVNVWKWFFGGLAVGIWTALIIVYLTYKK